MSAYDRLDQRMRFLEAAFRDLKAATREDPDGAYQVWRLLLDLARDAEDHYDQVEQSSPKKGEGGESA